MASERIRAQWRVRACSIGLCVGVQTFLTGTGVATPVCLNAAWMAALCAPVMTALAVLICHRRLVRREEQKKAGLVSRALHMLAAVSFLFNAAFACASLVSLAEQSLLPQAQTTYTAAMTVLAVFLCALSGGKGVFRFGFALRYALPAGVAILCAAALPLNVSVGLFPLLGRGGSALMLACACMLGAAFPVLLLLYEPKDFVRSAQQRESGEIPGLLFFLFRAVAGAMAGAALLFVLTLGSTYESLDGSIWGERLLILSSGRPREGLAQTGLTLLESAAMLLLGAHMLLGASSALETAFSGMRKRSLFVCAIALAACLLFLLWAGLECALAIAPALIVPLLLSPFAGRGTEGKW